MVLGPLEFVIGGVSACGAGFFTNPLEVAKTRMQLQGELMARGNYQVHYKNVVHAFYVIAKKDGILALQNGLVPALWYQLFMNGIRLGVYETLDNWGFIRLNGEQVSPFRSVIAAGLSGCVGAFVGSPFFMVKIQLQSMAVKDIAVGHQHCHHSMREAINTIYKQHGLFGLWRGVSSSVPRVMVGSATQLTTFSFFKQKIVDAKIFKSPHDWKNGFTASMISGLVVVFFMTPFDVVSTRVYNQGVCPEGKGMFYNGVVDCFIKVFKSEGLWGFYKGWGASLFRVGPHTVLTLLFWDQLKQACRNLHIDHKLN
ncbi:hypothetical protein HELRODRAFT_155958 [Helobdella robusta]|uniref:Solute carrier family 25 member 35 n=1 Tax=Helobdella robusta TaxID=6412 RepID=T1ELP6_HELRO|nr:hypothetical protein HELRODRAFT_155958 [Helobdella robusta]ESN99191.1 hypothetical protein HELRODRAFT_155958 [Helobdella robusta]